MAFAEEEDPGKSMLHVIPLFVIKGENHGTVEYRQMISCSLIFNWSVKLFGQHLLYRLVTVN